MVKFRVSHAVHDVKCDDGEKECDDEDFHDALIVGWFLSDGGYGIPEFVFNDCHDIPAEIGDEFLGMFDGSAV